MFYQKYVIDQFCLIYDVDSPFIYDLIHQHKLILVKQDDDFFAGDIAKPNAVTWIVWKERKLPVLFTTSNQIPVIEHSDEQTTINYDIIGSAFYFLSGWQEVKSSSRDQHGRFPFKESLQFELNMIELPVVNYYFDILKTAIETIINNHLDCRRQLPDSMQVCLSHDIDKINSGWFEGGFSEVKNGRLFSAISLLFKKMQGKDPYDNIPEILSLEQELGVSSTFFFLVKKGDGNSDYSLNQVKEYFNEIRQHQSEIALHGSLETADSASSLSYELQQLPKGVIGNRFHYLKFNPVTVCDTVENSGIIYDGSFGFAEHIGFRHGICHPFHPFNHTTKKQYSFLEIPLSIMDTTLSFAAYMRDDECLTEKLDRLINEVQKFNGVLSILWHNNYFSHFKYAGWKDRYVQLISTLKLKKARFYTHESIVKIYNA